MKFEYTPLERILIFSRFSIGGFSTRDILGSEPQVIRIPITSPNKKKKNLTKADDMDREPILELRYGLSPQQDLRACGVPMIWQ